jgi:ABC-type Na+ efflux pump permease subunit
MKQLHFKERRLALHPTCWIFLLLSAMVLIPNYPYYVIFFYTGLGIFFTCLTGRENQDVLFTLLLPVSRRQLVAGRMLAAITVEVCQFAAVAVCMVLRPLTGLGENAAGMEANLAFLGLSLAMLGLWHLVFFPMYYKNVQQVGISFLVSSVVEFLYIVMVETLAHVQPFFRDTLDTQDPRFIQQKLGVFFGGLAIYALLTALAYARSCKAFEKQDL